MRILHVISGMDRQNGGPPLALRGLAGAQATAGAAVTVLTSRKRQYDSSLMDELRELGVETVETGPCYGPTLARPGMTAIIQREVNKSNIVHIHGIWEEVHNASCRLASRSSTPYIIRPCGMLDPWSLSQRRWRKSAMLAARTGANLKRASALHCTTQDELDRVPLEYKRTEQIVEPNGASPPQPIGRDLARRKLADTLGIPKTSPVLLFCGRLHYKKGIDVLLKSLAIVITQWPVSSEPPRLLIAGPDEDGTLEQARLQADGAGLGAHVTFLGMVQGKSKGEAFYGSDLFCLTSRQENFGIAVAEAAAAGLPVLISDQVNLAPAVIEHGAGVVTSLDPGEIARQLLELLDDRARLRSLGESAKAWSSSQFRWDRIADRWLQTHYPRLIDAHHQALQTVESRGR